MTQHLPIDIKWASPKETKLIGKTFFQNSGASYDGSETFGYLLEVDLDLDDAAKRRFRK